MDASKATPRLVVFDSYVGWKDHLFTLEAERNLDDASNTLYVVYPDEAGKWRVQAVPKTPESFASRKALPEPWRGVRDEELSSKTGIPGCIFVHQSGFIGGEFTFSLSLQIFFWPADKRPSNGLLSPTHQATPQRRGHSRWHTTPSPSPHSWPSPEASPKHGISFKQKESKRNECV
ncbi:hypothetical protein L7F22_064202 [Adiantum nelumboides]|nr:hypothetical protein [Adiantum nelumboides]